MDSGAAIMFWLFHKTLHHREEFEKFMNHRCTPMHTDKDYEGNMIIFSTILTSVFYLRESVAKMQQNLYKNMQC